MESNTTDAMGQAGANAEQYNITSDILIFKIRFHRQLEKSVVYDVS